MKPVLKYLGGKSREIKYFEKYIPSFDTYIEPFCGGASVLFHLEPEHAIVNDIDPLLINFYKVLQYKYTGLMAYLETLENTEVCYYKVRSLINAHLTGVENLHRVELAALYYYLNRTSYGGHNRYNKRGELNMPYGHYKNDNFKIINPKYHEYLKGNNIDFTNRSFDAIFQKDHPNKTFCFLDPPYFESGEMYFNDSGLEHIYATIHNYMSMTNIKVMLIVKEVPFVSYTFKDMIVDSYEKQYRIRSTTDKTHKHLVICNY